MKFYISSVAAAALLAPAASAFAQPSETIATPVPTPAPVVGTPAPTPAPPRGPIQLPSRVGWPQPINDRPTYGLLRVDELEYQGASNPGALRWDLQGWHGGDIHRFWYKSEGLIQSKPGADSDAEVQLLNSKLISPFFDVQEGIRYSPAVGTTPSRAYLVYGLTGLAPYNFDVEPTLFLSQRGIFSARFTGSYDFRLTQRVVLQPRLEINAAAAEDTPLGLGAGLDNAEVGLRVRYVVRREFEPYAGLEWHSSFGRTRYLTARDGNPAVQLPIVAGVRIVL